MAEALNSSDKLWMERRESLALLTKHPAWAIYQEDVLDPMVEELRESILDEIDDPSLLRAARYVLRALVAIRERPEQFVTQAKRIKQELGIAEGDDSWRMERPS